MNNFKIQLQRYLCFLYIALECEHLIETIVSSIKLRTKLCFFFLLCVHIFHKLSVEVQHGICGFVRFCLFQTILQYLYFCIIMAKVDMSDCLKNVFLYLICLLGFYNKFAQYHMFEVSVSLLNVQISQNIKFLVRQNMIPIISTYQNEHVNCCHNSTDLFTHQYKCRK